MEFHFAPKCKSICVGGEYKKEFHYGVKCNAIMRKVAEYREVTVSFIFHFICTVFCKNRSMGNENFPLCGINLILSKLMSHGFSLIWQKLVCMGISSHVTHLGWVKSLF